MICGSLARRLAKIAAVCDRHAKGEITTAEYWRQCNRIQDAIVRHAEATGHF
jgi:hypothetical protein